jgi:hypothetical protein
MMPFVRAVATAAPSQTVSQLYLKIRTSVESDRLTKMPVILTSAASRAFALASYLLLGEPLDIRIHLHNLLRFCLLCQNPTCPTYLYLGTQ